MLSFLVVGMLQTVAMDGPIPIVHPALIGEYQPKCKKDGHRQKH